MLRDDPRYFSSRKIQEALQREVDSPGFDRLFQAFKNSSMRLSFFSSQIEFIDFMHSQEPEAEESQAKEELLQDVFRYIQHNPHPLWDSFLSLIFWPMLSNLFYRKGFWEPTNDLENFWHNIYRAFLETIRNLLDRPLITKIAFQVRIGTFSRLHDIYEQEWNWKKLKTACLTMAEIQPQITLPDTTIDQDVCKEALLQQYQTCLKQEVISGSEFTVLVGINIYGKAFKDFASETNTNYECLKKRCRRAQGKVEKYFEEK